MKSKKFWLGMLVFGIMVIGTIEAQTDAQLNGAWVAVEEEIEGIPMQVGFIFRDSNYESSLNGTTSERGSYTANNGVITLKPTHINGASFKELFGILAIKLQSRWYTINEFILAIRPILLEDWELSQSEANEFVAELMTNNTSYRYSVDANTLIMIDPEDGEITVYNKRFLQ